ncbi:hypothetical protein B0H14DRAFT_3531401 [Mycena olivaceomarginata]|nr:hypothetical protein B0H14DRAFT_3531401 [Mycena olivaceomarginata]
MAGGEYWEDCAFVPGNIQFLVSPNLKWDAYPAIYLEVTSTILRPAAHRSPSLHFFLTTVQPTACTTGVVGARLILAHELDEGPHNWSIRGAETWDNSNGVRALSSSGRSARARQQHPRPLGHWFHSDRRWGARGDLLSSRLMSKTPWIFPHRTPPVLPRLPNPALCSHLAGFNCLHFCSDETITSRCPPLSPLTSPRAFLHPSFYKSFHVSSDIFPNSFSTRSIVAHVGRVRARRAPSPALWPKSFSRGPGDPALFTNRGGLPGRTPRPLRVAFGIPSSRMHPLLSHREPRCPRFPHIVHRDGPKAATHRLPLTPLHGPPSLPAERQAVVSMSQMLDPKMSEHHDILFPSGMHPYPPRACFPLPHCMPGFPCPALLSRCHLPPLVLRWTDSVTPRAFPILSAPHVTNGGLRRLPPAGVFLDLVSVHRVSCCPSRRRECIHSFRTRATTSSIFHTSSLTTALKTAHHRPQTPLSAPLPFLTP